MEFVGVFSILIAFYWVFDSIAKQIVKRWIK